MIDNCSTYKVLEKIYFNLLYISLHYHVQFRALKFS